MGDVLVRKSISVQQQIGQPPSVFLDPFASGSKGNALPLRNPTGLERTPRAAAGAKQAGVQAAGDLARLKRTSAIPLTDPNDPNYDGQALREQNRIDRATMQDLVDNAALRSLQEQVAVKNFQRLQNYEKYNPNLRDRAAERAGKVGVLGSTAGKVLGGALGLLTGATALSDASAAGQDFTTGLMGAGLTGASTYAQTAPTLARYGAKAGGRIGSASVIAPHRAMNRMDNQPTMLARGIDNIRNRVTKPVAVTPTVAQPTVTQPTVNVVPGTEKEGTAQTTITGQPAPAPVAEPTQPPVMVQPTLQEAIKEFGPKTPSAAPEAGFEAATQNPTGAANQPAADLMGMGSMASQSSAGQQKLPKQEEEEQ